MMGNKRNRIEIGAPWNLYGGQSETRLFISEDSYGFQSRGKKSRESYGGQSALVAAGQGDFAPLRRTGRRCQLRGCKLSVRCSKRVHTLRVASIGYVWSTPKKPTASLLAAVSMCASKTVASMCASKSVMQISAQNTVLPRNCAKQQTRTFSFLSHGLFPHFLLSSPPCVERIP